MTTTDEARAEAERRFGIGAAPAVSARDCFIAGAGWQASRRVADRNEFNAQVQAERQHQIAKGYNQEHDDKHGVDHLLMWAQEYARRGEPVKSAALIEAAREALLRLASRKVEVTDEMVERMARMLFAQTAEARSGFTWPINGDWGRERDMEQARKVLECVLDTAALGGGE